ncbi:hypothetical protein NCAS_0B03200 [Naumovozyma castellii]|uniref:Kinase n=1 Tax=Naumovozyma castellii TaxID=27288 RepID=G0VBS8_NAUCA|nr:hypothetical protein NCAS_0B03200 [Naumovozyma castellii CBS 4309]CCC68404.1 hypothetical protein NCAS_0B03200 [Naumovozyma castellii CBS 4309]
MVRYKELNHKAAGHDGTLTDEEGILVFKPATKQETNFYQAIQNTRNFNEEVSKTDNYDIPLIDWMPTFLGILDEGQASPPDNVHLLKDPNLDEATLKQLIKDTDNKDMRSKRYLVLENLLSTFRKPNVLDVKLGKILYDDNATKEKKERLTKVSNETTSGSLGFRICGMKIRKNKLTKGLSESYFENGNDGYISVNKFYGRSRTKENIKDAFEMYFADDELSSERRLKLKTTFFQRLQLFYNTLLNEEVRMFSSSLLFIYEGDSTIWDLRHDEDRILKSDFFDSDSDDESEDPLEDDEEIATDTAYKKSSLSSMHLIDFAHSRLTPSLGYDENIVDGVDNLLKVFEELQNHA